MYKLKMAIAKTPILGRVYLIVIRANIAFGYIRRPFTNIFRWLFKSKETTNFTYDLEEINSHYLGAMIADITNIQYSVAMAYIKEIEEDNELRQHISNTITESDFSYVADKEVRFGRRIGWYVFARAIKPNVIIETGVDKGLGACVLTAALKRNKEEGHDGRYYGTDINPKAGYLLTGDYANFGTILFGDSIQSLNAFDGKIDLFINDSDHSAAYEAQEYATIENKLSEKAIVLGDNAHVTDKLLKFSLKTNRHFVFFQEKPVNHWYPGAGIGISFWRQ